MPVPTVDPSASLTPYQAWVTASVPVVQATLSYVGVAVVLGFALSLFLLAFFASSQLTGRG